VHIYYNSLPLKWLLPPKAIPHIGLLPKAIPHIRLLPPKAIPHIRFLPPKANPHQAPPTKGHPSYQAHPTKGNSSYQAPPTKGHPSYQASFRNTEIVNTAKLSPSKKNMIIYTLSKMIITLYCGNEVYLLAKTVSQIRMAIPTTVFKSNSYGYHHHCLQFS
jgi:hypothetical protein